MSSRITALTLAFVAAVVAAAVVGELHAQARAPRTAREILEAVHGRAEGDRVRARLRMTLRDGRGASRVRELELVTLRAEGGLQTRLRFERPSDVAGTTLLTIDHDDAREDEQWLHLPALRRTTRVTAGGRARSFLGSDLSFADLTRRHPDDFDAQLVGEETIGDEPCWHLELTPRTDAVRDATGYSALETWIGRRTLLVLRSKGRMLDGRSKYVQADDVARVGGVWVARRLFARTVRGTTLESETVLEHTSLRFDDPTVVPALFEPSRLGD
ncbi:MAG: outer membrane lipoprotein-sorting protein [Myxococcales bacterium]|nr:outer membrane lipoprotein-sorting protein [Myxococcales bacterium]